MLYWCSQMLLKMPCSRSLQKKCTHSLGKSEQPVYLDGFRGCNNPFVCLFFACTAQNKTLETIDNKLWSEDSVSRVIRKASLYFIHVINELWKYLLWKICINPVISLLTEPRHYTSPSSMLISTITGCQHYFVRLLVSLTYPMKRRSLQTTPATSWPSMATRDTFACSGQSSLGMTPMIPLQIPHYHLTAEESPGPGPGPAPILDPGLILGKTGELPKGVLAGPLT